MAKFSRTVKALIMALIASIALSCSSEKDFYRIQDGRIVLGDAPQYYIGTNAWYLTQIALSRPERLISELDTLCAIGVKNLRILATDENFEGLDLVLAEMQKRKMGAVLFLNNAWEWSDDCYISYLEKAGAGPQPRPAEDGYSAYMNAMWRFAANDSALSLYHEHVRRVVERYKNSPAVFSWQICNEPRPFSSEPEHLEEFVNYIHGTAKLIKSIDPNHMVSTGNEGTMGCNEDMKLFERINDCPEIDYITVHIWPYNWSWVKEEGIAEGVESAISRTASYIDEHLEKAYELRKAVVIEEFGYPRDGFDYRNTSSTVGRDTYYKYIFSRVLNSARKAERLAGCNFWAWSGFAKQTPGHQFRQEGDDLCGDPSQEAQGLNGVYNSDISSIEIIKAYSDSLSKQAIIWAPLENDWIFYGNDPVNLKIAASAREDIKLPLLVIRDLGLVSDKQDTVFNESVEIEYGKTFKTCKIGKLEPGFYQVQLGRNFIFNIGVEPEQISSPQDKREDFDEFWENTLKELAQVPLDAKMELVPEHSDDLRKCYHVYFKSLGGKTAGGILMLPTTPGKYPVNIEFMGYGAPVYYHDPSANPERIDFLSSVRDQGIFREGNDNWINRGLGSRETFYYRGAYCDIVRSLDFICSLEQADSTRIVAHGDSQGGAFTWVSAALDKRVRAIAPSVPFLGDFRDYASIVKWPMQGVLAAAKSEGVEEDELYRMLSYFDIKNMTDRVQCPVYMAFGLQDPVCPPHTNFAGYNQVMGEKKFLCVPTCGHGMWREKIWQKEKSDFFKNYTNN